MRFGSFLSMDEMLAAIDRVELRGGQALIHRVLDEEPARAGRPWGPWIGENCRASSSELMPSANAGTNASPWRHA